MGETVCRALFEEVRQEGCGTVGSLCNQDTRESLSAPAKMPPRNPSRTSVGSKALGLEGSCRTADPLAGNGAGRNRGHMAGQSRPRGLNSSGVSANLVDFGSARLLELRVS